MNSLSYLFPFNFTWPNNNVFQSNQRLDHCVRITNKVPPLIPRKIPCFRAVGLLSDAPVEFKKVKKRATQMAH